MAGIHLQRVVQEIIGSAEADPLTAPQAYVQAAQNFRALAQQPQFRQMATLLGEKAQEFEIRAAQHLAVQEAVKDDFEEQEQHFAEAYSKFGHHGNDMLVKAGRNEAAAAPGGQQTGAAASDVQRVCPIPISVESQRLGNIGQFKWADSANPLTSDEIAAGVKTDDTLVLWQDVKSVAQALTVDVGLIKGEFPPNPPVFIQKNDCRPYGIVEYGTDGYHSVVPFDVGVGTRFTVAGNYCSVSVGMDPPRPSTSPGLLTLGASLGFYSAQSMAPVTRTVYVDDLPVNTPAYIARPLKSVALLPPVGPGGGFGGVPAVNVTLEFFGWASERITSLTFDIGTIVCPIPLSNDVAAIILIPNTGIAKLPENYRLVFQLAL